MAAASNVIPLGLLYMRPLEWWLKTRGFSLRGNPLRMIKVTRRCLRALDMWRQPWFLSQGPVLGAPCRRVTLATDVSLTGCGAVMSGHSARGLWSGCHLTWHINCLEMLAVFRALKHFLPDLRDCHVLVRTDNTAVISYINHQECLRSRPLYRLAHQILGWSQDKLLSLRAVHIPGHLNMGSLCSREFWRECARTRSVYKVFHLGTWLWCSKLSVGLPLSLLRRFLIAISLWRSLSFCLLLSRPSVGGLWMLSTLPMSPLSSPRQWESELIRYEVWRPPRPFSQVSQYRTSAMLRAGLRPWPLSDFMALIWQDTPGSSVLSP